VLFVLGPAARAQEEFTWKAFDQEGKVFYQKLQTRTLQQMKVAGTETVQNQDQTFWVSWTPRGRKGRDWIVLQRIEGLKMDMEVGGKTIRYDSTAPPGPETPMTAYFKALVGAELSLTLGRDNKGDFTVKAVAGAAELIRKLTAVNPQSKPLLDSILSDDAVKRMTEPALAWMPNKPVKAGDAWEKKSVLELGPVGNYATTFGYTYQGREGELDRIQVQAALKYTAPAKPEGLPFTIKDADLKADAKTSSGMILFDREKGRVASARMHLETAGTLTVEIKGEVTRVELVQTQDSSLETSDTNPVGRKAEPPKPPR
jgi:hypothetical protein